MPPSIAGHRGNDTGGMAAALATFAGALLLLLALAATLWLFAETVARTGGASLLGPDLFDPATRYGGLAFAAVSLLALPAALAAPFARIGEPPLRSALALSPGALVGVVVLLAAFAAALAVAPSANAGLVIALRAATGTFESFVFLALPLACALGAAIGGARTSDSAAAAAAPVALVVVCGLMAELSIGMIFAAVLLPLLAAAAAIAILYAFVPAQAVTPWLAGIALAMGAMLLIGTGLVTPTEALALIAIFGLPIALVLRTFVLRQPLGAILRHMASETASVVAALAAGALAATVLALAGLTTAPGVTVAPLTLLLAGGAAFFAASFILTPVLVLALALPVVMSMLHPLGVEALHAVSIMILLALGAMVARAGRRRDAAGASGLTLPGALVAAGTFVALAALVAVVPGIALAPTEIMR